MSLPCVVAVKRAEKGTAALEFALVMPLFVLVFGGIISVGLAMWSRYQLLNAATQAARVCAFYVPLKTNVGDYSACVTTAVTNTFATNHFPTLCTAAPAPTTNLLSLSTHNPNMCLLQVTIPCTMNWWFISTLPALNFNVTASMPFLANAKATTLCP